MKRGVITAPLFVLAAMLFVPISIAETVEPGDQKAGSSSPDKGTPSVKQLPWIAFVESSEESRNYNLFLRKFDKPADRGNPSNWRIFTPSLFTDQTLLVPGMSESSKLGPSEYPDLNMALSQDPGQSGATFSGDKAVFIFAHQGTPTVGGWLAPKAGYAYQINGTVIFGTTNYTPINYNGKLGKIIDEARIGAQIVSSNGTKQSDPNRMFFIAEKRPTQPQRKVYPSLVYMKPGERLNIDGQPPVECPQSGTPSVVSVTLPSGEAQEIKVLRMPDKAVIPGAISP